MNYPPSPHPFLRPPAGWSVRPRSFGARCPPCRGRCLGSEKGRGPCPDLACTGRGGRGGDWAQVRQKNKSWHGACSALPEATLDRYGTSWVVTELPKGDSGTRGGGGCPALRGSVGHKSADQRHPEAAPPWEKGVGGDSDVSTEGMERTEGAMHRFRAS